MKPFAIAVHIIFAAVLLLSTRPAQGDQPRAEWMCRYLTHTCYGNTYARVWEPNDGTIPVYLNNTSTRGVQRIPKPEGGYYNVTEVREQLELALGHLRDEMGINLRLYYAGTTTQTLVFDGIVIRTQAAPGCYGSGTAWADNSADCDIPGPGRAFNGYVEATNSCSTLEPQALQRFDNDPGEPRDMWILFAHELLHALGLRHPTDICEWSQNELVYSTVSYAGIPTEENQRHWTKYDRETLQEVYGTRNATYREYVSGPSQGYGTSWFAGNTNFSPSPTFLYRFGSSTSRHDTYPQYRYTQYGWIDQNSQIDAAEDVYYGSWQGSLRSFPQGKVDSYSPPSVVIPDSPTEARIFYLEADPEHQTYGYYGDPWKRICYLTSTNLYSYYFGGCLTNPATGQPLKTFTDGVGAGWDPYRKAYIVTWIDDEYRVQVHTIPGPGSSIPSETHQYSIGHYSWEAPSVQCKNTSNGCLMVFMSYSTTGYLVTLRGGLSSYGYWSTSQYVTQGYDLDQVQTPSVSYQPWDDRFVLAYIKEDHKTVRSYKRSLTASSWTGGNTVVTLTPSGSAPSVGNHRLCFFGCDNPYVFLTTLQYQE